MAKVIEKFWSNNMAYRNIGRTIPNYCRKLTYGVSNCEKYNFTKMVNKNRVVVFMKGNAEQPRCGFSNVVVQIFRMHGVNFDTYDVLADDTLREGIKKFTNWPTIPQVYMNGEFVGGSDIIMQMHQSGDLVKELKKCGIQSLISEGKARNDSKVV